MWPDEANKLSMFFVASIWRNQSDVRSANMNCFKTATYCKYRIQSLAVLDFSASCDLTIAIALSSLRNELDSKNLSISSFLLDLIPSFNCNIRKSLSNDSSSKTVSSSNDVKEASARKWARRALETALPVKIWPTVFSE